MRRETNSVPVLRNCDRSIVGIIGSVNFGGNPQAVATVKTELDTPCFAGMFLYFVEQVLTIGKTIEENPWANIGSHYQLNDAIEQLVCVVPAPV